MDKESYLYLTGRAKSLIVTEGGKNVFPEEIENCFQLYDEVGQILVRGFLKDKAMKSEGIEALIYPDDEVCRGADAASVETRVRQIVDEVNRGLPMYKRIDRFEVLSEPLEMTRPGRSSGTRYRTLRCSDRHRRRRGRRRRDRMAPASGEPPGL